MKPYASEDYSEIKWGDRSWKEIEERAKQDYVILIPLGSIEQHGPMLPVECDWFLAESWAFEGAKLAKEQYGVKVLVLPPIPYGVSTEHMDFAGTVSLSLDTYIRLLQEIIREVIRAGFKKIACVSGHGGNIMPAKVALRDLKSELKKEGRKDAILYMADGDNCFMDAQRACDDIEQPFHFHASACETSYYMFQRPDLLKKEWLKKPVLKRHDKPLGSWWTKDITESGASGDPSKADLEHGKEIFRQMPRALAAFLDKVSKDARDNSAS